MVPTPLGPGRLEASLSEHGIPQQATAPHLHRKQTSAQRTHSPLSILSRVNEPHLNGNVCVRVSSVEDGPEVELGVSRLLVDT